MLRALRTKNIDLLAKIDDIQPIDIDDFIEKETNKVEDDPEPHNEGDSNDIRALSHSEIMEKVILKLIDCNIDINTAKKAVVKVLKGKNKLPNIPVLVNESLKVIFKGSSYETIKQVKTKKQLKDKSH